MAHDPHPHGTTEYKRVQAAKLVHRMASGTHKRWEQPTLSVGADGTSVTRSVELHAYPRSRGRVLRHIGEDLEEAIELLAARLPTNVTNSFAQRFMRRTENAARGCATRCHTSTKLVTLTNAPAVFWTGVVTAAAVLDRLSKGTLRSAATSASTGSCALFEPNRLGPVRMRDRAELMDFPPALRCKVQGQQPRFRLATNGEVAPPHLPAQQSLEVIWDRHLEAIAGPMPDQIVTSETHARHTLLGVGCCWESTPRSTPRRRLKAAAL